MNKFGELREIVDSLKKLLDDPHPGLITWNAMVADKLEKLEDKRGPWWIEKHL